MEFKEGEGIEVGDWVRARKTMHTMRGSYTDKYEMTREGRVIEIRGAKMHTALVRINLKELATGEWITEDMPFNFRVLTVLKKKEAVSA